MKIEKLNLPFYYCNVVELGDNKKIYEILNINIPNGYYGIIKKFKYQFLGSYNPEYINLTTQYIISKIFLYINDINILGVINPVKTGYPIGELSEFDENDCLIYVPENGTIKMELQVDYGINFHTGIKNINFFGLVAGYNIKI